MDLLRERISGPTQDIHAPMKARDISREDLLPYLNSEHAVEPKLDGVRLRVQLGRASNLVFTGRRSVRTFTHSRREDNFPHLRDAVVPDLAGTVLDGELLAPGPRILTHTGSWTDSLLNASVALAIGDPAGSVATQVCFGPAVLWAFDVPTLRSESMADRPYDERREVLEEVVARLLDALPGCPVRLVPQLEPGPDVVARAVEAGHEGVVVKRRDSLYVPGARDGGWCKVKVRHTADAWICGYSPGERGNRGLVGSLELAVTTPQGPRPVARVGNLGAELRRALTAPDGSLRQDCYGIVAEFEAQSLTRTGRARSAQLLRFRPDKAPEDCGEEQLEPFPRS
jgi:ATP-dependent DNA ligase